MARILVVDDNATSRKLVVALLSHDGHVTFEAGDGEEGLAVAQAERPQLVISDILMPSMDGYGFVRRLRADPALRGTPVIFHTAHYHEREAHKLAQTCRVARVLVKPCPAAEMLRAVEQTVTGVPETDVNALTGSFDREHLVLVTNKLSEKVDAFAASKARLMALNELSAELAREPDRRAMLRRLCMAARNLVGARYAVLAAREYPEGNPPFFATVGIDCAGGEIPPPQLDVGALGEVLQSCQPWRRQDADDRRLDIGLPYEYPAAGAFLIVPLTATDRAVGWLCLADKVGAMGFSEEDETLLGVLGAQCGRIFDTENQIAAAEDRAYRMMADLNAMLAGVRTRTEVYNEACRLALSYGDFKAVCLWIADPKTKQLVRVATAGEGMQQLRSAAAVAAPLSEDRAIATLPLMRDELSLGCLTLCSDRPGYFNAHELRFFSEMAGGIALALRKLMK
jgi:CheY-like chemotaxis protein